MSRKGMFTENWDVFFYFFIFFCSKHLNMHHSLPSLKSRGWLGDTRTAHTHLHQLLGFSTYVRVQIGKLERSGLARACDSPAGNTLHVIISIHLHERVRKIKDRDTHVKRRHAHCQSSSRKLTFGEQHQDQSCKCVPQQGVAHDGVLTDFRFVLMRTKPPYSSFTLT